MKTLKAIITTLILTLTMLACTPEPEPPVKEYTYNNNVHQITEAYTVTNSNNRRLLAFLSDGLALDIPNNTFSGQGNMVFFWIPDNADITGVYNRNASPNDYDESAIEIGKVGPADGNQISITGTIIISNYSGGGYKLEINDPTVNLTYEGTILEL